MEEWIEAYHRRSRGFYSDPPALAMPRIIVASVYSLTPGFLELNSVTHILNCAYDDIVAPSIKQKYTYACLHMDDHPSVVLKDYLCLATTILDAWLRDPKCKNVVIHCQAGINRSASIAAGYASTKLRIPAKEVMNNMLRQRPCMFTNEGFVQQLLSL